MNIDATALLDAHKQRFYFVEAHTSKKRVLVNTIGKMAILAFDFTRDSPREQIVNTVVDIIENTLLLIRLEDEENYFTLDINGHVEFHVDHFNRITENNSGQTISRNFLVQNVVDMFSEGYRPSFTFIEVVAFSITQLGLNREEIFECYFNRGGDNR